jgi:hypothetical protein
VLGVTAPTLAGGETGAGIPLGGAFTFLDEYAQVIGRNVVPGPGGFIPARLSALGWRAQVILPALVACWLLSQISRLVGLLGLTRRSTRADPAAWLLAGMVLAGTSGALLIRHVVGGSPNSHTRPCPPARRWPGGC